MHQLYDFADHPGALCLICIQPDCIVDDCDNKSLPENIRIVTIIKGWYAITMAVIILETKVSLVVKIIARQELMDWFDHIVSEE